MPNVQLPDNTVVQFPDNMPEADINAAIAQHLGGQANPPASPPPGNIFTGMAQSLGEDVAGGMTGPRAQASPLYKENGELTLKVPEILASPMRGVDALYKQAQGNAAGRLDEADLSTSPDIMNAQLTMLAPALTAEGAAGPRGMPPKEPVMPTPSAEEVRAMAGRTLGAADLQGGQLKPAITNAWADKAQELLPQSKEAKTVLGSGSAVDQMVKRIQGLRDQNMSLQGTLEIDRGLGDLIHDNVDPATGKVTTVGNQYLKLQRGLRDLWENATEADTIGGKQGFDMAKQGRDQWAASARMNDIERIINRANLALNPATAIKTGMRTLVSNPERMRGFSEEEAAAVKDAAKTGAAGTLLKLTSSRLVAPMIGGFMGGGIGAGAGSAIAEGSNMLINKMQNARAAKILQLIASRPAVQAGMTGGVP